MMYFTLDSGGVILSLNTRGAKDLGYRLHELIGQTFTSVTHEEDRRDISRKLAAAIQQPGAVVTWESRNVRQGGSTFWTQGAFRAIHASDGPVVVLVVCQDVSERRRIERELSLYQSRLRRLASELSLAEERERRFIAVGLHDEIGQTLTIAKLSVDELLGSEPSAEHGRRLARLGQLLSETIQKTRALTFEISSPVFHELGLEAGLQSLGKRLAERQGIHFELQVL